MAKFEYVANGKGNNTQVLERLIAKAGINDAPELYLDIALDRLKESIQQEAAKCPDTPTTTLGKGLSVYSGTREQSLPSEVPNQSPAEHQMGVSLMDYST